MPTLRIRNPLPTLAHPLRLPATALRLIGRLLGLAAITTVLLGSLHRDTGPERLPDEYRFVHKPWHHSHPIPPELPYAGPMRPVHKKGWQDAVYAVP